MRSQSLCLLERLAYLGPGAKAAAERRRVIQQLEERQRREAMTSSDELSEHSVELKQETVLKASEVI